MNESKESQHNVTSPGTVENIDRNISVVICWKEESFFDSPPTIKMRVSINWKVTLIKLQVSGVHFS